eukprot:3534420-Rhodomonas_salina.1
MQRSGRRWSGRRPCMRRSSSRHPPSLFPSAVFAVPMVEGMGRMQRGGDLAQVTRRSRAGHAQVTRRSRAGHAWVTHWSRMGHGGGGSWVTGAGFDMGSRGGRKRR